MYTDPDCLFDSAAYNTGSLEYVLNVCEREFSLENPRAYFVVKYFWVATKSENHELARNARRYFKAHLKHDVNIDPGIGDCISAEDAKSILLNLSANMNDTLSRKNSGLRSLFHHVPVIDAARYLNVLEAAANVACSKGKSPLPRFSPRVRVEGRGYGVFGALMQKLRCCR